jgi:catechol 2,3-dioxygenase-like lactoylglutathione lyase family enzyme
MFPMMMRFDHAVIGVHNLDEAIRRYQSLGFDVSPGGRHTGLGTYNAIVRFGLDYLELISIYDENEVYTRGFGGKVLLDFLRQREGGLLGYALATTAIRCSSGSGREVSNGTDNSFSKRARLRWIQRTSAGYWYCTGRYLWWLRRISVPQKCADDELHHSLFNLSTERARFSTLLFTFSF